MRLKNCDNVSAYLTGDNDFESRTLLTASMAEYSPRAALLDPHDNRVLILLPDEAEKFAHGALRDDRLDSIDKWAISKLIACWLSGEITDEAIAERD